MRKQLTRAGLAAMLMFGSAVAWSCEHCRPLVKSGVYNANFIETFLLLGLPLLALLALGMAAHYMDRIGHFVDKNGAKRRRLW